MFDFCFFFYFFKRTYSDFLIGTQCGSVFSSSVGIQCRGSNVFYAKDRMLAAILSKKDGQLLCSWSVLSISKPEPKLLSTGLYMRTNNVEVLKNDLIWSWNGYIFKLCYIEFHYPFSGNYSIIHFQASIPLSKIRF